MSQAWTSWQGASYNAEEAQQAWYRLQFLYFWMLDDDEKRRQKIDLSKMSNLQRLWNAHGHQAEHRRNLLYESHPTAYQFDVLPRAASQGFQYGWTKMMSPWRRWSHLNVSTKHFLRLLAYPDVFSINSCAVYIAQKQTPPAASRAMAVFRFQV